MIPKSLRDQLGLQSGEVEVHADGIGIRVEPLSVESLVEQDGRLVIPPTGAVIDDDTVRALREAGRR